MSESTGESKSVWESQVESREAERPYRLSWRLETAACETTAQQYGDLGFHPARLLGASGTSEIELAYAVEPHARPRFALALTVNGVGGTDDRDGIVAYMRHSLTRLTGRARFSAADHVGLHQPLAHRIALVPAGFTVRTKREDRALGFSGNATMRIGTPLVATPSLTGSSHIDTLTEWASAGAGRLRLHVRFLPVQLAPVQISAVERLLAELRGSAIIEWPVYGERRHPLTTPETVAAATTALSAWLHRPRGYRILCEISCEAPICGAQINELAQNLLAGWQIVPKPPDAEATNEGTMPLVNLQGCVNEADALPAWLPSPTALRNAGVARHYPSRPDALPERGLNMGSADGRPVRLAPESRLRHLYICGASGAGKSTLLYNLAVQDIREGQGLCVVDPHGDLHDALLASIPPSRIDDVVVIDPTVEKWSVGLNFLECGTAPQRGAHASLVVGEIFKIFESLYDMRNVAGPMFELYMRNALLLLLLADGYDEGTLVDVIRVFEDRDFRKALLTRCSDPLALGFWTREADKASGDAALSSMTPYVTSKLNQFVTNPLLRPIIGQPRSTVDLREVIDEGRILLVNLARGRMGRQNSHLLGMLVLGRLFLAALSRADAPVSSRRPFHLYVDEFQNVATDTMAQALAESRKYGLSLTLANQTLSQVDSVDRRVLESILGNCGSFVFFRLGASDAERLCRYVEPELGPIDLQRLPNFNAAARLLADNHPLPGFVFQSSPSVMPKNVVPPAQVLERALAKHARQVAEVETELRQGWTRIPSGQINLLAEAR